MEPTRALLRRMAIATNRIDGTYYLISRAMGATENAVALLYALDDGEAHTQKQISQEWLIPKTTLNTIVKECVSEGYIRLEPHAREKTLRLTEAGRAYAKALLEPLYAAEGRAMEAVLSDASPEFVTALERFAQELQSEFDRFIVARRE